MNLLPYPRVLKRESGFYTLPKDPVLHLDDTMPRDEVFLPVAERLTAAVAKAGSTLETVSGSPAHPRLAIRALRSAKAPNHEEGYALEITPEGIRLHYREIPGLRAGVATLRQLLHEQGRRLPCLSIRDQPDFRRRGVMLDISRGRVPRIETLLELVEQLADFKINEFQLYIEHTFAYRNYQPVWKGWGPITGGEILRLDRRCRELGIELVPNQNSFGHLRYWLEYPPLKKLAEVPAPYASADGTFVRYPSTLAPTHRGTLPFLRGLYDELLPYFTSSNFNVGCDETWDLGRGQSKGLCQRLGKGRVYVDFLKKIHAEVTARGKRMMFWGDIVLRYPELLEELPRDLVALNWGYEARHPFENQARIFGESGLSFYVCPGTSSWMTLIGRHDNAFANLRNAAAAGLKNGASGYLNTDWGDGGHPQPLAVSYLPYLYGAALGWCAQSFDEKMLIPVLSRDVFEDRTGNVAGSALRLGLAHREFDYFAENVTPFGTVLTAPHPRQRELVCRDGLKYYARIPRANILRALRELEHQRSVLGRGQPRTPSGWMLQRELDLASRMAAASCGIMLWQQALASGKDAVAAKMARRGVGELEELKRDFEAYWPSRNKGTTQRCSPFFRWRIEDYKKSRLQYPPKIARGPQQSDDQE